MSLGELQTLLYQVNVSLCLVTYKIKHIHLSSTLLKAINLWFYHALSTFLAKSL